MKLTHLFFLAAQVLSTTLSSQEAVNSFWSSTSESSIRINGKRQIHPQKYKTVSLLNGELRDKLFQAPHEKNVSVYNSPCIIYLPVPDGSFQKFRVVESPVVAEESISSFSAIKTFAVVGVDDQDATGRLDWNEFGFHGMISSIKRDYFIDPFCVNNTTDYQTYYTADFEKPISQRITEGDIYKPETPKRPEGGDHLPAKTAAACVGSDLRTYRIAVACTGEYAKAATSLAAPTITQAYAKIVTTINRINQVYQKEVAIRLILISTETLVVFTDPATDPFTGNNNAGILINESQSVITTIIGSPNFDIGHTFSTGGGGLAGLGVVCSNSNKAWGITGSSYPVGDPYDIDFVAHEVGHQFSGNHTFNANTGNCNGNRNNSTAVEPGSGITIMGYAGICASNNLANRSIPYFHGVSYDEIVNFSNLGGGNTCPVTTTTGNQPPVVTAPNNYIIPISTPFILTGTATDPDGDKLYYSWEEMDAGVGGGGNWNSGTAPYFRSYAPDTAISPGAPYSRYFPKKSVASSGNFISSLGEYLPGTAQILQFRLTARDNKVGGGGVCSADMFVTIDPAGPFTVTYPSAQGIDWPMNSSQIITWDMNGTEQAPISCDSVRISISYDAGNTFSVFIASTSNDGMEYIIVPALASTTTTCRIKIESIGNIFYDVSNRNFTISEAVNIVGVKKVSQNNPMGLQAWPNPFEDQINFAVGNLEKKSSTYVSILDVLGRTMSQYVYVDKIELMERLDLSALSTGVYFVKVNNSTNQSFYRLVKH